MSSSLSHKTVSALLWSFFERLGVKGVTFVFSVILARILTPDDFGIVAMPMMFLSLSYCFVDCGFGEALIRKEQLTSEEINTAFMFNLLLSIALYLILYLIAPFIANFYHVPILVKTLRISAICVLLAPWNMVQNALLTRGLQFNFIGKASVVSSLISGFIGLIFAFYGWGVWALVVQGISVRLIQLILLWRYCSFKPNLKWSNASFHYLWNYGSKVLLSGIINNVSLYSFPVIIGRIYSPLILGNFMKAVSISLLPTQQITDVIQRVTFPVFCKIHEDVSLMEENFRKTIKYLSFASFPLSIGMVVSAKSIVKLILGDQWFDVVPIMQLLCLGVVFLPLHAVNLDVLRAKGRSDLFLYIEVMKFLLSIIVVVCVYDKGILYIAASVVIISFLSLFINTFYTKRYINVSISRQLLDVLPIALISCIMGVSMFLVNVIVDSLYVEFVLDIITGLLVYLLLSKIFLKSLLNEIVLIAKKNLRI